VPTQCCVAVILLFGLDSIRRPVYYQYAQEYRGKDMKLAGVYCARATRAVVANRFIRQQSQSSVDTVVVRSAYPDRDDIFTAQKMCDIFAGRDDSC
jgi:hypothetical protein